MAISVSPGYTAASATKSLTLPDLDFDGQFAAIQKTAHETILTNTTSPLDQPEKIRYSAQNVNNIYANSGIDPAYFSTSKRGVQILSQVNDILRVTDSADNTFRMDLPVSAHVVVRTAVSDYLSASDILSVMLRAFSSLFDEGGVTAARLTQLLRGGTTPANL